MPGALPGVIKRYSLEYPRASSRITSTFSTITAKRARMLWSCILHILIALCLVTLVWTLNSTSTKHGNLGSADTVNTGVISATSSLTTANDTQNSLGRTPDCVDPGYCEKWDQIGCACSCPSKRINPKNKHHFIICPFYNIAHLKTVCSDMLCPATTVWEQKHCKCLNPIKARNGEKTPTSNKKGNCELLIDYKYSKKLGSFIDYQKNHVKEKSGAHMQVETVLGATASGKAASFEGTSVQMPVLEYNGLGDTMLLKLRLKPDASPHNNTQIILSNECYTKDDPPRKDPASILLSYLHNTNKFTIGINTLLGQSGSCQIRADPEGWYRISVSVRSSITKVIINSQVCTTFTGQGPISKNSCPLTIGGAPLATDNSSHFYGHLDYIRLFKYCHKESR
ncbi:uncharacterized protein LOC121368724 [Gigantopelta aegis]|uniref:uncharacterized protein LOC121368724 n=1 Tax=Gigantopelta aegis TaxID=1735272 RepID=UPI001B889838|nr:uncharacterized protein LOC121368724 [Gigantopelta aegis]